MTKTYDDQNVFAKILRGEIPSHRVYEDEDVIAIMDVMPQGTGHALVVPKAPSRNLLDADPETLAPVIRAAQRVARAAMRAFDADGVTITQFNEAPAGQSVFHLHVHVIPRFDGVPLRPHTGKMEDQAVLAANADKLRKALAEA
jgi:histidine triad (HIT) family protein